MNYEQMIAEEKRIQSEMEANETFKGYKLSELRKVFECLQNKENWKLNWAAEVPSDLVPLVLAASIYFHGCQAEIRGIVPLSGKILMAGKGYQG